MNLRKKKILMISGSTKSASTNSALIDFIIENNAPLFAFRKSIRIDKIPHYNPDLEGEFLPEIVKEFRAEIKAVDALIFCTPEYVFSLPGSFKNAIEWLVSTTLLSQKDAAIIVAASSGDAAMQQLIQILNTLEVRIKGSLVIKGAKGKFDPNGQLNDESTIQNIEELIENLNKPILTF